MHCSVLFSSVWTEQETSAQVMSDECSKAQNTLALGTAQALKISLRSDGEDRVHFGGRGKHGDFSGQTVGSKRPWSTTKLARSR